MGRRALSSFRTDSPDQVVRQPVAVGNQSQWAIHPRTCGPHFLEVKSVRIERGMAPTLQQRGVAARPRMAATRLYRAFLPRGCSASRSRRSRHMKLLAGSLDVQAGAFLHAGYLSAYPRSFEVEGTARLMGSGRFSGETKVIDVKKALELKDSHRRTRPRRQPKSPPGTASATGYNDLGRFHAGRRLLLFCLASQLLLSPSPEDRKANVATLDIGHRAVPAVPSRFLLGDSRL